MYSRSVRFSRCPFFANCRPHVARVSVCRRLRVVATAGVQPSLLEVFAAVSEGRLSPLDAAQTVEETLCTVLPPLQTANVTRDRVGTPKAAERVSKGRIQSLLLEQGRALVTGIDPPDYATIRKAVPGVVYHAGAKTLRMEGKVAGEKLPGSIGILSDTSVPLAAVEELQVVADFFGCYTFQLPSLTTTHLTDVVAQLQSLSYCSRGELSWELMLGASQASVVVVVYNDENALPDIVAGSIDAPVICVRVGGGRGVVELPSGALATGSFLSAALSAAKILKTANRFLSAQLPDPTPEAMMEERVVAPASLDEQIQDALELLNEEVSEKGVRRVNNVVTSEVRESAIELSSD